ncbi:MAG TPA: glycoside hydrolase family 3 protein [Gemmatimonadaceae bacterium]|nr:glycoside hydrolase family 3 protein [Gemmatimonadaceae bacterium]
MVSTGLLGAAAPLFPAVGTSRHAHGGAPTTAVETHATPGDDRAIDALLARMTVREKAAQMIMPWVPGGLAPGSREFRRAEQWVTSQRVGGLIVGKGDRQATTRAIRRLQARSRVPLLVASDLEWGAGMRLLGATLLPTAMAVAATGDTALAYAHGRVTAAEARAAGLHVALAPVLDVNVNPRNPIINTRSFGEDPHIVARFGAAVVRGLQDGGLVAVAKHFPGHGDTEQDSHLELPTIAAPRARLDSVELVPFRSAIEAGVGGIMVGHIAAPALDAAGTPASLSRAVTTTVLRGELGFDGLVMTDALNMAGVASGREMSEIALRAVRAGADILLQPKDPDAAIDAIVEGVSRGEITRSRLDASARRILRAKARVGLMGARPTLASAPADSSLLAAHVLADSISARSITLLRDAPGLLPARFDAPIVSLTYAGGVSVPGGASEAFEATLRAAGARVERLTLSARTATAMTDSLFRTWAELPSPPLVILSSYSQPVPWRGTLRIPDAVMASAERIAQRTPVVHVAFGSPYMTASVPSASTVIVAWSGIPAAQRAAARAILGVRPTTGRLPISLLPEYALGHGLISPDAGADR